MKKLFATVFALLIVSACLLAGCDGATTHTDLDSTSPWGNTETLVYNIEQYTATVVSGNESGKVVIGKGTQTLSLTTTQTTYQIDSSWTLTNEETKLVDTIVSSVTMHKASFLPIKSSKTVTLYDRADTDTDNNSYTLVTDYVAHTSTMTVGSEAASTISNFSEFGYDNESLMYVVRALKDTGSTNPIVFTLRSMVDAHKSKIDNYPMKVSYNSVLSPRSVPTTGTMANTIDGKVDCYEAVISLNVVNKGTDIMAYFAAHEYTDGTIRASKLMLEYSTYTGDLVNLNNRTYLNYKLISVAA